MKNSRDVELLARIVNQALEYRSLMLTADEFLHFREWSADNPHASVAEHGKLITFAALPVYVFADFAAAGDLEDP